MPTPKWKPGQSGNPNGRPPKERALASLLRTIISHKDESGVTLRRQMLDKLASMAVSGDLDAMKVILDRIDGKAIESLELSGPNGGDIAVKGYRVVSPDDWPEAPNDRGV